MDEEASRYVWAVEWRNPFSQDKRSGLVLYDITLQPGVTEEEFQQFLAEQGFAGVSGILTRAIQFGKQHLLRAEEQAGPDPLDRIQQEGVAERLGSLATFTRVQGLITVMSSETDSEA